MNRELLSITSDFNKEYYRMAEEITASIMFGRIVNKTILEKKVVNVMTPIITNMFSEGMVASNLIVKKEVAKLVLDINIPFKYNKDLLLKLNDKSIFTGYYDKTYKSLYSKSEIDKLKRVILSAKYSGWDEKTTIKAVKNIVGLTGQRAMLLARNESARLTTVAKTIYFEKAAVRNKYDLVWHNSGGNVRAEHAAMAGKKANKDGMFNSDTCGMIPGPPFACSPFNCKCYITLENK